MRELPLLFALLLAATLLWFFAARGGAGGDAALVCLDGKPIKSVDLRRDTTVVIPEIPGITLTVRGGAVAVTQSDCPDRFCMRSGYISRSGQTVVCVPKHLSVRVEGGGAATDAVAG